MSIRAYIDFPETDLRRVQAYASLLGITPSEVILQACAYFLESKVGSEEYEKALRQLREAQEEQDD